MHLKALSPKEGMQQEHLAFIFRLSLPWEYRNMYHVSKLRCQPVSAYQTLNMTLYFVFTGSYLTMTNSFFLTETILSLKAKLSLIRLVKMRL